MFPQLSRALASRVMKKRWLHSPAVMYSSSTISMKSPASSQSNLPRLPVPPLHPSLEKYLLSVRPLLTDDEYSTTKKITEDFGSPGGIGVKLHSMLKERAKTQENWLEEWWLNSAYMEFRMPLISYSSPGLVFPIKEFQSQEQQLRFAARLIAGALDFKMLIDKNVLPSDKMGNKPLDMSQYFKIFSTCRMPGSPSDSLNYGSMDPDPAQHIVVSHNNHFFKVNVYGADGVPLNESQILDQLSKVVQQSQKEKNAIGVLTSQHRDVWAAAYKRLKKSDPVNKESIQEIQRSIFLICLDKAIPQSSHLNRRTHVALQTIHGGGGKENTGNRWYDKTIQFIVGADGVVGLTYEHSPAEGPPIVMMMDHVLSFIEKTKGNKWLPSVAVKEPKKLQFNLSENNLQDIEEAEQDLDMLVKDLDMSCFSYDTFGKDFVKSQRLSPDSFVQMALQLAFYSLHNQIAATYESASLRKFLHGRTETIRSASVEALDFCKTMRDEAAPAHMKAASLRLAIDAHKDYTNLAINGMGIDRLLLGLKKIAIESGLNVPDLFLDAGFTTSTHFKLSTSQVSSKMDAFMCYGPAVPDGYGCCYNPLPSTINFGLSACNSSPETSSNKLKDALIQSLTEMHDTLLQAQNSRL